MAASASSGLLADLLARCPALPAAGDVVCAVSGGADSMALLALATAAGARVTAVHVDHGLRPGSAADAAVVAHAADRFGAAFRAERVVIEVGPNLEARARAARFAVLPDDALTGHTADDQAETVLLNLMRGAGSRGLSGMGPGRHPLLGLRRSETQALCRSLAVAIVEDPSNESPRFRRNRVRHELVPLLSDIAERDVVPVLARAAEVLRDDADLLDALASAIDPTDARALAAAPVALARRAVRLWLGVTPPVDLATVDRVLAVARGDSLACDTVDGRRVRRSRQRLSLEPRPAG